MTNSMGSGGLASDTRRMQRAIEQLRREVQLLEALVRTLTARLEAVEDDD